jgi:hypothetical protein
MGWVQIITYILMSTVVFFGFAHSFFLAFYTSTDGFQSLRESLMSMVRFTSGDVNYEKLQTSNTALAPLLYTMALFVLSFVWTSLLLAIVISAYYVEVNDVSSHMPSCFNLINSEFKCQNGSQMFATYKWDKNNKRGSSFIPSGLAVKRTKRIHISLYLCCRHQLPPRRSQECILLF